jgi:hypothetical protein
MFTDFVTEAEKKCSEIMLKKAINCGRPLFKEIFEVAIFNDELIQKMSLAEPKDQLRMLFAHGENCR